jgi:histidinol-phosphatase (PHP family)
MLANYHTHTARCGHAVGTDRAYVETAIARGLRTLGFSDHVPMPFSDGHESRFCVPLRLLDDYVKSVLSLKQEYANEIEIRLGFEAEYYPDLFPAMLDLLRPYPTDYLLLAQHFVDSSERVYNTNLQADETSLVWYVDRCLAGMRTGAYSCLAHPDLFHFTGKPAVYRREMTRLCAGAKELGVPLEINLLGLREHKNYPCAAFWKIAGALQCPTVLGCDAHAPEDLADPKNLRKAETFAKRFGIVPLPDISLQNPFRA